MLALKMKIIYLNLEFERKIVKYRPDAYKMWKQRGIIQPEVDPWE